MRHQNQIDALTRDDVPVYFAHVRYSLERLRRNNSMAQQAQLRNRCFFSSISQTMPTNVRRYIYVEISGQQHLVKAIDRDAKVGNSATRNSLNVQSVNYVRVHICVFTLKACS